MIHLVEHEEDMGVVSWCNATYESSTWQGTDDVDTADCDACLLAAFEFGIRSMRRRLFLKDGRILRRGCRPLIPGKDKP